MRVQLTPDEIKVLIGALARHNRDLVHEIARTDHREFKQVLQNKLVVLARLENELSNELSQDELQLTAESGGILTEVLDQSERALYFEIARTDDREFRQVLQKKLEWLRSAQHKFSDLHLAA